MTTPSYVRQLHAALHDQRALDFFTRSIKDSYLEFYGAYATEITRMIDESLMQLVASQCNGPCETALQEAVENIKARIFHKGDDTFWFNAIYRKYKHEWRPQRDFGLIERHICGRRVLDLGCGGGYFALHLSNLGHDVYLTDVLDYRIEAVSTLPFVVMQSPAHIPYPSQHFDVTVVKNVLHHVDRHNIPTLIEELLRVSARVIVQEDTYSVQPEDVANYYEAYTSQAFLREYLAQTESEQYHGLVLLDFFANAIALGALGAPEINFPFGFRPPREWKQLFQARGFGMKDAFLFGFEPGKMHRDCQAYMVFDSF